MSMNPHESTEPLNPLMDLDTWLSFYQSSRGGTPLEESFEADLMNIINMNTITSGGGSSGGNRGRFGGAAPVGGTNKNQSSGLYNLPSFINSAEATSVTTMALPRSFMNTPASVPQNASMATTTPGVARPNAPNGTVKVKKKRVRASRRVPTTVLRTDTSNFKAMVQHFTGIPSDSSSSSSSSSSTSTSTTAVTSTATTTTSAPTSSEPPFTKPLPHPAVCKIPPTSSNPSTTSSPPLPSAATTTTTTTTTSSSDHGAHFSLPFTHDLPSPLLLYPSSSDAANSGDITEGHAMPAMDAAFFEKLWS